MKIQQTKFLPILFAILAAVLFGISAPLSKLLLGDVDPILLAALLYLGSGLGVLILQSVLKMRSGNEETEARLVRSDYKWLAGAVFCGGVVAPIVLLYSLQSTPASTASLLLNFEGVATALIAGLVFKEAVGRRAAFAMVCITVASIVLSWNSSAEWGISLGALGIVGACILWGIDNNLTRNISAKNPLTIVLIKGFGAGLVNLFLAIISGNKLPALPVILGALALGSLSYGCSIVLFILALRGLGTARSSALFGTAPLAGVILSFVLFHESPSLLFFIALALAISAMIFLLSERHTHAHVHEALTHDHRHQHNDGHHLHSHPDGLDAATAHSHVHSHERLAHDHPHLPDIEHRHAHS